MIYVQKDLLNLPEAPDYKDTSQKLYEGILICPTGQTRLDNQFLEFAIIGCRVVGKEILPAEIITCVHGASFDFILDPIKGEIKMDMVGFGILRLWTKQYWMSFNLNSSEALDIDLIPKL